MTIRTDVRNAEIAKRARAGFYVDLSNEPSPLTQTYSTADRTHPNMTSANLATTAATNTSPYGFADAAQADDIAVQFNALRADVIALKKLVNALIDDLQAVGLEP